ncbi:MAG: flagellar export chaperone FliS [Clostridia bacterium]|jgi:flagellar protein FliS|nr:flagellar export chaperone FliS [Clostridia bacterium]
MRGRERDGVYQGAYGRAYQTYQQNQVQTAGPEKLVTMLYDGAIRFLTQGETACRQKKVEETHRLLLKAQSILAELMSNVNRETGDIGESLFLLYDYLYRRSVEANLKKDPEIIVEVKELIKELRDTWVEAVDRENGSAEARSAK